MASRDWSRWKSLLQPTTLYSIISHRKVAGHGLAIMREENAPRFRGYGKNVGLEARPHAVGV